MQSLSYAQTVKSNSVSHSFESKTRRPNCLNFRHKQIMKRQEAITFLKQLQYSILKLTGVGEMKAGTIDVTCKQTWGNRNVISNRLQLITFFSVIVIVIDY